MKFSIRIKTFTLACFLTCFLLACNNETRQKNNSGIEEFSEWVDEKAERAETATEEEWDEMQAEYALKTKELKIKRADWDDQSKAEWEELKQRWKETESKTEARFRAAEVNRN